MSGRKHVWSWRDAVFQAEGIEPGTVLLCLALSHHMSDSGSGVFPSFKRLCAMTRMSPRSIQKHTKKAVFAGLLVVERRRFKDGRLGGYLYCPSFPEEMTLKRKADDGADLGEPAAEIATGPAAKNGTSQRQPLPDKKNYPTELSSKNISAKQFDGALRQPSDDLVSYEDGVLELHGAERETYLEMFDGNETLLRLALDQAGGYVQPNGSKPLIVQVRAQLGRQLADRIDKQRRNQSRAIAVPRQFESHRQRKEREGLEFLGQIKRGEV